MNLGAKQLSQRCAAHCSRQTSLQLSAALCPTALLQKQASRQRDFEEQETAEAAWDKGFGGKSLSAQALAGWPPNWPPKSKRRDKKQKSHSEEWLKCLFLLVGAAGFELATPCTPCKCATRLRYAPTQKRDYSRTYLFFQPYSRGFELSVQQDSEDFFQLCSNLGVARLAALYEFIGLASQNLVFLKPVSRSTDCKTLPVEEFAYPAN